MLYKKRDEEILKDELFKNPTKEYRGAPFWAWNTKPEKESMKRQMKAFDDMGFGGFHIHSRTGLDVEYLGDEFMDDVKFCTEYAKDNNMLMWAYDEDRFPSGFAGGLVTKDRKYRYRELFMTFDKRDDYLPARPEGRAEESYLIAVFDIVLNDDGTLKSYNIVNDENDVKGVAWYTYLRIATEDTWFNNQTYVDTLDKSSIERFVNVTHERYKEVVGEYFDDIIPSFFTDEPKTTYKKSLPFATERRNLIFPWTDDFPDTFKEKYGFDMIPHIPELVWELEDNKPSKARYFYHRHVAERFTESYSKTISDWCEANNVHLTGHMIKEPSLKSQSTAIGEAMLPLSEFGIPGIDMLCDEREYTTAKQAQSVAHQYGREGVVSELYGVTNWDFDFRRHKLAGDWQAALGVTIRVPHLSWMTMEGEAKRDYPASIHYQSPWYKEYKIIEDYFARVATAMTRGNAVVKIGLLHPVESLWLKWADEEHTGGIKKQLDENFQKVTEWLLFSHLDFDYLSESVMERIGSARGNELEVGSMKYSVVVVPGVKTIRRSTFEQLKSFVKNGGTVIFAGEVPGLIDAQPTNEVKEFSKECVCVSMEQDSIVKALEPFRTLHIVDKNGSECNKLLCQVRQDNNDKWIFVCYGKKKERYDNEGSSKMMIKIPGRYTALNYNAMNGTIENANVKYDKGLTIITCEYSTHESVLLKLSEAADEQDNIKTPENVSEETGIELSKGARILNPFEKVPARLDEPNVYMLDLAQYSVDGGEYRELEEVLRIGVAVREELGITAQSGRMAQPWTGIKEKPLHTLSLKYIIESKVEVNNAYVALEHYKDTQIQLNGRLVESKLSTYSVYDGATKVEHAPYYTDEKINTVALPALNKGKNELILTFPIGEGTDVENAFVLGDFGVEVCGTKQIITDAVKALAFGDIVPQGLPFYGGNVTYLVQVESEQTFSVKVPYFRGSLIAVEVDEKRVGTIAFAPYKVNITTDAGKHTVGLKLYGNRINTFGTLHNCNENTTWFGPDAWRTKGDSYSYEYQLKKVGILKRPDIQ